MQINLFCGAKILNKMFKVTEQQRQMLSYSKIKNTNITCTLDTVIGTFLMNSNYLPKQHRSENTTHLA